jgi:hypothetical protein
MPLVEVEFRYETGLAASPFRAASLMGSWTRDGGPSEGPWSEVPMEAIVCEDGGPKCICQAGDSLISYYSA